MYNYEPLYTPTARGPDESMAKFQYLEPEFRVQCSDKQTKKKRKSQGLSPERAYQERERAKNINEGGILRTVT